jgi:hypothetical protein
MALFPKGMTGFGSALQETYPLLLAMSGAMQQGQSPFAGAPTGLAGMMQMREAKKQEEEKRAAQAMVTQALAGMGGGQQMSGAAPPMAPPKPFQGLADQTMSALGKPPMGAGYQVAAAGKGWTDLATPAGVDHRVGTRAWRNNNPGNIEYGPFAQKYGAVGTDGRFAVFPSVEAGRKAQEALLFDSPSYKNLTVGQAISRYAPPSENDSGAYAGRVAQAAGVGLDTRLSTMGPEQRKAMLDAMAGVEGFKPGQSSLQPGGMTPDRAAAILESQYVPDAVKQMVLAQFQGGQGQTEYGLTPQYAVDTSGALHMIQLGKDGSAHEVKLPDGLALQKGLEKLDLGTAYQWYNNMTGQPIGQPVPKNLSEAAAQTAEGKAAGETKGAAAAGLPGAQQLVQQLSLQIDDLLQDPYLSHMLGPVQSRLPNVTGEAARVQAKIEQLSGGAFLQARQLLKGGGAITDYEGNRAEAAFVRMSTAQNMKDFSTALRDFEMAVRSGVAKLQQQSGAAPLDGGPQPDAGAPATGAPALGATEDGYRFLGGDPGDPKNWEKIK